MYKFGTFCREKYFLCLPHKFSSVLETNLENYRLTSFRSLICPHPTSFSIIATSASSAWLLVFNLFCTLRTTRRDFNVTSPQSGFLENMFFETLTVFPTKKNSVLKLGMTSYHINCFILRSTCNIIGLIFWSKRLRI